MKNLPNCACFNLRKTARAVTQLYDSILKPVGLRGTQFTILSTLAIQKSYTITKLSDFLIMDRTTLTRNLKPLEREKIISVLPGTDKRNREITLTKKGETIFNKAFPLWLEAQKKITNHFGKNEFNEFLGKLKSTTDFIISEKGK